MCFSPSASFTAGVLITAIGIRSIAKADKPHRLLACTPLLFGIQQLSEGGVWLALLHYPDHFIMRFFPYLFLFFAMVLWPLWVPACIAPLVRDKIRKFILYICFGCGIATSAFLLTSILYFGAVAQIVHHHIMYTIEFPVQMYWPGTIVYIIATVVPWFLTKNRLLWLVGILMFASYGVTYIFYANLLTSVWCFFAALLSVIILFAVRVHK